jgi:hypothetical protein
MGWRGHPECHRNSLPRNFSHKFRNVILNRFHQVSFRPEGGPFLLARSGEIYPLV